MVFSLDGAAACITRCSRRVHFLCENLLFCITKHSDLNRLDELNASMTVYIYSLTENTLDSVSVNGLTLGNSHEVRVWINEYDMAAESQEPNMGGISTMMWK